MTKAISEQSFKEFKLVAKALQLQVKIDKKDHVNNWDDIDFGNLSDDVDEIAYDYTDGILALSGLISNNDDIVSALNLDVDYEYDGTYIYKQGEHIDTDNSICVADLLDDIQSAIKRGRTGIGQMIDHNLAAHKKIDKLEENFDD